MVHMSEFFLHNDATQKSKVKLAEPENIPANPACIFNAKLNNTIISARN